MKKIWNFCKKEAVLSIAVLLAIASAFVIHPDKQYMSYIDFRTLAILFCLMAVMAGLQKVGVFYVLAEKMLSKVKHIKGIILVLVMLCFFSSMLITNDVALITFVPFTFIVLQMILGKNSEGLMIPIVVMQTIAANLGSMLTPIGNPQNLYLYGKMSIGLGAFMMQMLPLTAVALLVLVVWCLCLPYKGKQRFELELKQERKLSEYKKEIVVYCILFLLCLLTVAHIIPYGITLVLTLLVAFVLDKAVLKKVDYALLLTFVGFFIFIGNMGRVPAFNMFVQRMMDGNEILTSIVASQFMSNVPAALLLSGFTDRYELLVIGTNLGGLGTLIASMASLISFKYVGKEYSHLKGKYMLYFTVANVLFLGILLLWTL